MGDKNRTANDSSAVGNSNDQKAALLGELHDAVCILESLIWLTRHHRNNLGDESQEAWVGLSLILGGVLDTVVDAREALDKPTNGP